MASRTILRPAWPKKYNTRPPSSLIRRPSSKHGWSGKKLQNSLLKNTHSPIMQSKRLLRTMKKHSPPSVDSLSLNTANIIYAKKEASSACPKATLSNTNPPWSVPASPTLLIGKMRWPCRYLNICWKRVGRSRLSLMPCTKYTLWFSVYRRLRTI